jgi:hypothetical protein
MAAGCCVEELVEVAEDFRVDALLTASGDFERDFGLLKVDG